MFFIPIQDYKLSSVSTMSTCHTGSGNCNCGGSGCQKCVAGSVENFYLKLKY